MQLAIETFDNSKGGNSFYKAVTHPLAARRAAALLDRLGEARRLAMHRTEGLEDPQFAIGQGPPLVTGNTPLPAPLPAMNARPLSSTAITYVDAKSGSPK